MPVSTFRPSLTLRPTTLTQSTFSPFGTVIECPFPPSTNQIPNPLPKATSHLTLANQNTALKYLNVTDMVNLYADAPSGVSGKAVMNMFSCFPRSLRPSSSSLTERSQFFDVKVLERHPYTTQTFVPLGMGLQSRDLSSARYLVIVAPTLTVDGGGEVAHGNGKGMPDLKNARAFWGRGEQGVTYGAGTWHAPMVVVGRERVDFVVVQYANGVAGEDCEEVEIKVEGGGRAGVCVEVCEEENEEREREIPKL
ncbi:MAG: hypothetical protein Q9190_005348 [Brigantiaea leucoxantha]